MNLLIFDIDGTLTNTKQVDDFCFIKAFQDQYGIMLANTDWTNFANVTDTGLYNDLYFSIKKEEPAKDEKTKFLNRFILYLNTQLQLSPEEFKEISGAKDFIDHCLTLENTKIAFATGAWLDSAKIKLTAANLFFNNIPISSSDFFVTRQDIIKDVIEKSKQMYSQNSFDNIIYFGDAEWDFKTTKNLQMPFIGVDNKNTGKLKELGANFVINDFKDIASIINIIETIHQSYYP